jgi:hypothetical protein
MDDMKEELGHATSAVEGSNANVKHHEDQVRESNKKVYSKSFLYYNTKGETLNTPVQLWADFPVCGLLLHLFEYLHSCTVHIKYLSPSVCPYTCCICRTNVQIMIKFDAEICQSIMKPLQFSFRSENFN